jgi:hypothetical protein
MKQKWTRAQYSMLSVSCVMLIATFLFRFSLICTFIIIIFCAVYRVARRTLSSRRVILTALLLAVTAPVVSH